MTLQKVVILESLDIKLLKCNSYAFDPALTPKSTKLNEPWIEFGSWESTD